MAGVNSSDLVASLEDMEYSKPYTKGVETRGSDELGKDEFLKLLLCQLQNQDPLNPQDDTSFIAQLAQFSALEQMTNMSATLMNSSAYSLVGKEVIVQETDAAGKVTQVRGTVDYVEMQNGNAKISVNGNLYSMDDLLQVMDSFYAIKQYLPSVEEQKLEYDSAKPTIQKVRISLGSNGYEANNVVVAINGNYIDPSLMTFEDGVLSISPKAFEGLTPGTYALGFYFDDPYQTTVTDKVVVKIVRDGGKDGTGSNDDDGGTEGTGGTEGDGGTGGTEGTGEA